MSEFITITTRRESGENRTFDTYPSSSSEEIAEAIKNNKLKIDFIHQGQQTELSPNLDLTQDSPTVIIKDSEKNEIGYALYHIDIKGNEISISKKITDENYRDEGLSQVLLACIFELIKADKNISPQLKQNVLADIRIDNFPSIFSRVKTPALSGKRGYYHVTVNPQNVQDIELKLEKKTTTRNSLLEERILLTTDLLKTTPEAQTHKIINLTNRIKKFLQGK